MVDRSLDGNTGPTTSVWRHQTSARRSFRRPEQAIAERVAQSMIARHGVHAAREATEHLNMVIDRGDLTARDLWAYVVHIIHAQQNGIAAVIDAEDRAVLSSRLEILAK
jgi:hypothetical protein